MTGFPPRFGNAKLFVPDWEAYAAAFLDYDLSLTDAIDPETDAVLALSLVVTPSGAGELTVSDLRLVGTDQVVFSAGGGQARRQYSLQFTVTMRNGRVFVFVKQLLVLPTGRDDFPAPLASWVPGSALTWNAPV